jgi:hypothetical protein
MPCVIDSTYLPFIVRTHYLYLLHWRRKHFVASRSSQVCVLILADIHEAQDLSDTMPTVFDIPNFSKMWGKLCGLSYMRSYQTLAAICKSFTYIIVLNTNLYVGVKSVSHVNTKEIELKIISICGNAWGRISRCIFYSCTLIYIYMMVSYNMFAWRII